MNNVGIVFAEKRFGSRTNAKSVLELFVAAHCYPCNFGSKALNVVFFLLEKALGDKHRHTNIFVSRCLEHSVKDTLDIFPDSIAIRANYHTALYRGVFDEFCLFADVRVPLSEVLVH